ncbi:MAG: HEAT repeat domain-containing protein [Promethearchaeota archaeon]
MSKELAKLLKKAESKNNDDRYYAVVEIADLAEREAIQPLVAMINDPSDDVKLVVASTLGFLGERHEDSTPVPALVQMFKNAGDNADLKYRIIESLGMIGDPEVGRLLSESIGDEGNPEILKELISAIGKVKYKPASSKIIGYLDHDEEVVRLATAMALGEIGDVSVIDALFKAADDVSSEVAGNAIISIGKIGDKSAIERLFGLLDKEPRLPARLEAAVRDAIDMIK